MQNPRLPSFFQARTTVLAHGLYDFLDGTNVQHLLKMGLHFIVHVGGISTL